jgi:DNA repair protein SbcC/Rad50
VRLVRLTLENFRQHANTAIRFRDGLTGIIGPNGSGKSTILEAIAWAVYGVPAARGKKESIRFSRAPARSRVEVELVFELGGHEFRVTRTMHDAEVFVDGGGQPVATGIAGATAYLQGRLGMNREEFFNTYFTGQKELQFLANMGPTDRAKFLNRLLGYERLRVAQDIVRARRTEFRHELEGLRQGQQDPIELEKQIVAANERFDLAGREHEQAGAAKRIAAEHMVQVVPLWTDAQKRREAARENAHALESAQKDLEAANRDVDRATKLLEAVATAESELGSLAQRLEELPALVARNEEFDALRRAAERRELLERNENTLKEEIQAAGERMTTLERSPELITQYENELQAARSHLQMLEEEVEGAAAEWTGRHQETTTRLHSYRERAQELKEKIRELKNAGPDGTCPTCERPLRDEFEAVITRFEDEYYTLVQDGKWLGQREKQLAVRPDDLVAAEKRRDDQRREVEELTHQLARCEQAVQELWTLGNDRRKKESRLAELRTELASLAAGYAAADHADLRRRLDDARQLEKRAAALASMTAAKDEHTTELADAKKRATAAKRRIATLEKEAGKLGHDEAEFAAIRARHEDASQKLHGAELYEVEQGGRVQAAMEAQRAAQREMSAYRRREEKARVLEREFRHHNELDSALTRLRLDLNSRVRPELGELASTFLGDITNGRYTAIEIDENYNVMVLDEGEEQPVISGGEEDMANLVLRLAISQMIAERAGQQLSILILDEVFGSLDVEHRDNVLHLLHRLEGRFEQVILITHIEGIRESLDNVLRVEYDERTGSSRVFEDAASGSFHTPQLVP